MLITYVDDLLMIAATERANTHGKELQDLIEFKDEPGPDQFIGAYYALDPFDKVASEAPRTVTTSLVDYTKAMVARFCADSGLKVTRVVDTPYTSDEVWAQDNEDAGRFADIAA
jgi:hypothetical protein